ncbi:LOG family protein [bacterium]|nr:LOG family protein [bacterium]
MSDRFVAVFGASASMPGDGHYEEGVRCGRLLTEAGFGVVTGGYSGLMAAVSEGASSVGGRVIGVTVPLDFPDRPGANEWVTEEIQTNSITERIHEMTQMSIASIALHGSLGTLTELAVAWNLAYVADLGAVPPKPVIAVGPRWGPMIDDLTTRVDTLPGLVTCVATVDEAVDAVIDAIA